MQAKSVDGDETSSGLGSGGGGVQSELRRWSSLQEGRPAVHATNPAVHATNGKPAQVRS